MLIVPRIPATDLAPGDVLSEGEVMDVTKGDGFVRVSLFPATPWGTLEFSSDALVPVFG